MKTSWKLIALLGLALLLAACARPTPPAATPIAPVTLTPFPPGYPPPTFPPPTSAYPAPGTDAPTEAAPSPTEVPPPTAAPSPTEVPASPTPALAYMALQDFEMFPSRLTISAGTTVVFLIKSTSGAFHEPYSISPAGLFDSGPNLGDGATYPYTFTTPGTYTIGCGYHPDMTGTIVVTP